jgi:hypothetical protein
MEYICPLCQQKVEFEHIIEDHIDYWALKGINVRDMPKDVESFNNRFSLLGLTIEEF